MRENLMIEVNKLLATNSPMYVVGYLEGALTAAMQHIPKEEVDRLMQVYFYNKHADT
jgi:uncharacterized protein YcsI (UPF0317 family)